jgi:hypothetical protein
MAQFTIRNYTFFNPVTQQDQDGHIKVYLDASGNPTGEEEEYYGMSAEAWLSYKGYTSIRLLTLLDIERKLEVAGKTAPKLTAVRGWIDSILMQFAIHPEPKISWDEPPYEFEPTLQEALTILNS